MNHRVLVALLTIACLSHASDRCRANEPLAVVADFEGASVRDVEIDEQDRSVSFMPGGDPQRGWPCWWYFRIDGIGIAATVQEYLAERPELVQR